MTDYIAMLMTLGGAVCIFFVLKYITPTSPRAVDAPLFKVTLDLSATSGFKSISSILTYTYPRFRDQVFRLKEHFGEVVVIPPKFVNELKAAPESLLSFQYLARQRFFARYTLLVSLVDHPDDNTVIKSIQNDLTKHLGKVVADVDEEVSYAFDSEIGACEEWTPIFPAHSLLRVIALASGRIFVGSSLNRNKDYLDCIVNFTIDSMMGGEILRGYPAFLRPFAQWWIPGLKNSRAKLRTMKRLIGPILKQRLATNVSTASPVQDMLTWNLNNSPPRLVRDIDYQAHNQLIVSAAAIHTTNMQLSHALFDLASHPEYIEPLRDEVTAVVAAEPTGAITKTSMPKLRKLDSFMKESQRTNPLGLLTFERRVMSDLTLSNGITIPRGNYIGTPTSAIARDHEIWNGPEIFDAFRFERLRTQPGADNKHQFVTTGIDSLYFGHGKHACPGRFFAAYEMKLILMHLIMKYDVKLPDGESRPANIEMNSGVMVNPIKTILLRKRD